MVGRFCPYNLQLAFSTSLIEREVELFIRIAVVTYCREHGPFWHVVGWVRCVRDQFMWWERNL